MSHPLIPRVNFIAFGFVAILTIFIDSVLIFISVDSIRREGQLNGDFQTLSTVSLLICALMLSFSLTTKPNQLNFSFFWLFQKIFFGYVPVLNWIDSNPYYLSNLVPRENEVSAIQLTVMAEIIVAFSQIILLKKKSINRKPSTIQKLDSAVIFRRLQLTLLLYLFAVPFLINELGGWRYIFRQVRYANAEQTNSISVLAIYESFLLVPPLICLLAILFSKEYRGFRLAKQVRFGLFLWIVLLSNPLASARQTTLFMLTPLVFYSLRNRRLLSAMFFTSLPIFLLYSANLVNRYTGEFQSPTLTIVSRSGDFDAFMQLSNGIEKVANGEFKLFSQILGSVFFFIPRSIWEGKPFDTGVELARLHGLQFQNLSAPWILESFVNARIIGVVVVSVLIAFLLSRLDLTSQVSLRNSILASIFSGLIFIILRGSLLQATGRAVFCYLLIALIFRKGKSSGSVSKKHTTEIP